MRLVADVMLAKLARWLRLFGVSVENPKYVEDERLMRYAKRTGSVLLTSDRMLAARAKKKGIRSLLVENTTLEKQLRYVVKLLKLTPKANETICPVCNSKLAEISKESASKHILKKIAKRHDSFHYCRKCKKVYWRGSHWKNIEKMLGKVK